MAGVNMKTFFSNRRGRSIPWSTACAKEETLHYRTARSLGSIAAGADLHEFRGRAGRRRHRHGLQRLRRAPVVQHGNLLHAGNRAAGSAEFCREELAAAHLRSVLGQGNSWVAALLRTPVHESVLANVQVARTRAAAPVVFLAAGDVVLKIIEARKGALSEGHDFLEDPNLGRAERLELPVVVVDDSDSAGESERDGAMRDGESVLRVFDRAAQHRIDVDLKNRVLRQHFQATVESFQALQGNFVGRDVVDADLQVLEAG